MVASAHACDSLDIAGRLGCTKIETGSRVAIRYPLMPKDLIAWPSNKPCWMEYHARFGTMNRARSWRATWLFRRDTDEVVCGEWWKGRAGYGRSSSTLACAILSPWAAGCCMQSSADVPHPHLLRWLPFEGDQKHQGRNVFASEI